MTDFEKAQEIARLFNGKEIDSLDILIACLDMAKWKDVQSKGGAE